MRRPRVPLMVQRLMIAALPGVLLVAAGQAEDLDTLQGTWRLVRSEVYGKRLTNEGKLVIKGDQFTLAGTQLRGGEIKLDPKREPKVFEKTMIGFGDERTNRGIYQIEDDTYRECATIAGEQLPTDFTSEPGSKRILDVWRRTERPAGALAGGEDELDGVWKLVSRTYDGKPVSDSYNAGFSLTLTKNQYILRNNHVQKGTFRLDPSTTPKQIDYQFTSPASLNAGEWPGIYRIEGDTFEECHTASGSPRPQEFITKPGNYGYLRVFKRIRP